MSGAFSHTLPYVASGILSLRHLFLLCRFLFGVAFDMQPLSIYMQNICCMKGGGKMLCEVEVKASDVV